jgi:glycosyltransferase involved in cell wall biosynthesis
MPICFLDTSISIRRWLGDRMVPAETSEHGPVFFINARAYEKNGVYFTDPANWKRLKLFLEPFQAAELIVVEIGDVACEGWLPIPDSVKVLRGYHGDWVDGLNPVLRRVVLAGLIFSICLKFSPRVIKAPFVGLLVTGPPLFYAGLLCALLFGKPVLSIFIGSISKSYLYNSGRDRFPGVANFLKGKAALFLERLVAGKSLEVFAAGERLLAEIGRGSPFSTSGLAREDLWAREDSCLGARITWVYAGAINYEKGVDVLLKALHELRKTDRRHRAVLVGSVSADFPMDALLGGYQLAESVSLAGVVPWSGVKEILRGADVFVFLSLHEGMPKAPLEAMSQGVPVIVTATGADSYVTDQANGLIVPTGDPGPVIAAVTRIASDGMLRRSLISGGYRTAIEHTYDNQLNRVQGRVCNLFPDLTDARKTDWTVRVP